jgi:hypothetical protein
MVPDALASQIRQLGDNSPSKGVEKHFIPWVFRKVTSSAESSPFNFVKFGESFVARQIVRRILQIRVAIRPAEPGKGALSR